MKKYTTRKRSKMMNRRRDLSGLSSDRYKLITAPPIFGQHEDEESTTDRQEKIPGFNQKAIHKTGIFMCGAGGLFAQQAPDLLRKGYGLMAACDPDFFSPSNIPRQLCQADDLYQNKAISAGKYLKD